MSIAYLECIEENCRRRHSLERREYHCDACGSLLDVRIRFGGGGRAALLRIVEERKSSSAVEDQSGVWRFREMLPFVAARQGVVTLGRGTDAARGSARVRESGPAACRLDDQTSGKQSDGLVQGSGNDRVLYAGGDSRVAGVTACASTGNTSASMSAYAVRAGMKAVVFVPVGKIDDGETWRRRWNLARW